MKPQVRRQTSQSERGGTDGALTVAAAASPAPVICWGLNDSLADKRKSINSANENKREPFGEETEGPGETHKQLVHGFNPDSAWSRFD